MNERIINALATAASLAPVILEAAWKSTILGAFALAASVLFGHKRVLMRSALCNATVCGLLLLPCAITMSPRVLIHIPAFRSIEAQKFVVAPHPHSTHVRSPGLRDSLPNDRPTENRAKFIESRDSVVLFGTARKSYPHRRWRTLRNIRPSRASPEPRGPWAARMCLRSDGSAAARCAGMGNPRGRIAGESERPGRVARDTGDSEPSSGTPGRQANRRPQAVIADRGARRRGCGSADHSSARAIRRRWRSVAPRRVSVASRARTRQARRLRLELAPSCGAGVLLAESAGLAARRATWRQLANEPATTSVSASALAGRVIDPHCWRWLVE